MGQFSDTFFGKRARIDKGLINQYMQPADDLVQEQIGIARGLMDPNSAISQFKQNQIRENTLNIAGAQNQNLLAYSQASNMNPAAAAMQARANMHTARGQSANAFNQAFNNQYTQGLNLFNLGVQGQQQIGERHSNLHISQVDAKNAARQNNMDIAMGVAGMVAGLPWGEMG